MTVPTDWWKDFFTGIVLEWWSAATPEEQTRAEADFLEKQLGVRPPARLLDVPCGNGRHSRELARRGYRTTGVDYAAGYIEQARAAPGPAVEWERRDMRDLPWQEEFDGAFSLGNSFGYLDDDGNADFFKAVGRALKPGARFLLNASVVAEALLPHFREREWYSLGDILFLADRRYDPARGRVDIEYTVIRDGTVDRRPASYRVYPYRELCRLLEEAGFTDCAGHGGMDGEPFRLGSRDLFLVAARRAGGP